MSTKHPQTKVEKTLTNLKKDDLEEWQRLVRFNPSYSSLAIWLNERGGDKISVQNVSNWWIINRPRGNEAVIINQLTEEWAGLDAIAILNLTAGLTTTLVNTISNEVENRLASASIESLLTNLTNLLRELRQASAEIQKAEMLGCRDAIFQAGMLQMAEYLREIFQQSPFGGALETGINAALTKHSESG